MNMASMSIFSYLLVILTGIGNAKTGDFASLDCKAENMGQYGRQSLLECVIKVPEGDTVIRVVSWKKANRALLVFRNGSITVQKKGFSFAQPSWNLRTMNVSLLITNIAVEDQGRYSCYVSTDDGPADKKPSLKVTAKYSKPTIVSSPEEITLNTDGTLTCESDGGYPKGQLRWFDEHNVELTSDAQTEATQTDGGLFQLSRKLVVRKESSFSKYTCSVFNASGGQEEETPFQVKDVPKTEEQEQRKELDTATKIVAPVVVIGSLIVGLLLLALLIYKRQSQSSHVGVPISDVEEGDDKYPDNVA